MAIITASNYKTYAGISDTSLDARLAVLIPIAQERIEALCGRPAAGFETATWTQDFDGHGGPKIFCPCWPVTSITSVSWRAPDGTLTALDSTCYQISADARFVEKPGSVMARGITNPNIVADDFNMPLTSYSPQFREGLKNFRVVYVGGYSSIPEQIKMAAYQLLNDLIIGTRQPSGLKSESDGRYTYVNADGGSDPNDPLSVVNLLSNWMQAI